MMAKDRDEDQRERYLDEEIRSLMEDYTEEDRAFLDELWEMTQDFS